ncbi:DUF6361 family protein [Pirellulaceae bacterium SH449]
MAQLSSYLGWIDFSEEDQKRAQDYLRSLSEGTLDELGFGIIRDAFADLFFPATSTIMTRARYFIFVPSIYLAALEQGDSGAGARRKCDRMELALRKQLIANKAIENFRKEEVKRYPASIYWAALRRLGIVNSEIGSQASYFDATTDAIRSTSSVKDDDHNAIEPESDTELWDAEIVRLFENNLIPKPDNAGQFSSDIDFRITKVESNYLRKRFLDAERGSVVANVFRNDSFQPADYPWQWDYPESLKTEVYQAEHFSMLAKIATLLYYRLLDTKRKDESRPGCGVDLDQTIHDWWRLCRDRIHEWDIDQFLIWIVQQKLARGSDRTFILELHGKIRELSSSEALVAATADLIVAREKDKRPNKRRLIPGRFQNEWKLPTQRPGFFNDPKHLPYLLDFRSGIASQIIADIFEGLRR